MFIGAIHNPDFHRLGGEAATRRSATGQIDSPPAIPDAPTSFSDLETSVLRCRAPLPAEDIAPFGEAA